MKFSESTLGKTEIENEKRFGVKITFDWFKTYEDVSTKDNFNAEFCFSDYSRFEKFTNIDEAIRAAKNSGCIRCKVRTF